MVFVLHSLVKLDGLCRSISCTGYEGQSDDDYEEEDVYGEGGPLILQTKYTRRTWDIRKTLCVMILSNIEYRLSLTTLLVLC